MTPVSSEDSFRHVVAAGSAQLVPPTVLLCHPFESKCLCFVPEGMVWASQWPERRVHLYFPDCTLGCLVDQAFAYWNLHILGHECKFWREVRNVPVPAALQDSLESLTYRDRQQQPLGLNVLVVWSTPGGVDKYKVVNYSGG